MSCNYNVNAGKSIVTRFASNQKINAACMSLRSYMTPMRMLLLAGLVNKWQETQNTGTHIFDYDNGTVAKHNLFHPQEKYARWLFPTSSYDANIYLSFVGWEKRALFDRYSANDANPKYYLAMSPHTELENDTFYRTVVNHNTLLLRRFIRNYHQAFNDAQMDKNGNMMAISSTVASELDAKIDDGRPGTGKFLASKGNLNEKYCYDKTYSDVDKAIYNKDDRLDFGCNILYVMEDVK